MTSPLLNYRPGLFFASIALFAVGFLAISGLAASPAHPVRWETDLNTATARAEREQRPLFLHFVGNGSPSALQMHNEVFVQPNIAAQLNANFVMVRINASENSALAHRFSVTAIPTDLVMRPNGQAIHRRTGVIPAETFAEYLAFLQRTIQAERNQPSTPAAPPVPTSTPVSPEQTPAANPAAEAQSSPGAPLVAAPPTAMPLQNTMPPQNTMGAVPSIPDPFAQQSPVLQHPAAVQHPPVVQNPAAVQHPPVAQHPAAVQHPPVVQPSAPVAGAMSHPPAYNPLRASEQAANPPQHPGVASSLADYGSGAGIIREFPADMPAPPKMMVEVPLALEGFCPVTLYTKENWIPGNPAFSTMYQGHIFRFATMEALVLFAQNPANYVPVAMGEDIVLMVDRNRRVNGSRQLAAYCQGRILLFSSQETYDAFEKRADYYMEIALRYEMARKEPLIPVLY